MISHCFYVTYIKVYTSSTHSLKGQTMYFKGFLLQFFLLSNLFANNFNFSLEKSKLFYKNLYSTKAFIPHINPKSFYGTYLVHNVSFQAMPKLKQSIEKITQLKLIDRGEAHITILSPPEFNKIQKYYPNFSMLKVHDFVKSKIQKIKWKTLGIGHQSGKNHKGLFSEVFYLVVQSKELRQLRFHIMSHFQLSKNSFNPNLQDFHITIAYTVSDLHNIDKSSKTLDSSLSMFNIFKK